jgi:hypothetical protein
LALSITNRGTGTHNTGATSFTLSPASNFASGSTAVLCVAADNSAAGGTTNDFTTVTDTLGNTWTRQQNPVFDNGAASAGVQGTIYTSELTSALQTGTVITVNFGSSPVAKTWTLTEVAPAAGKVARYRTGGTKSAGATGTAATSGATASVNVGEVLVAAIFIEAGTTQTCTGDSDTTNGTWSTLQYTEIGSTTSGSCIASQAKLQTTTASTQTHDVTLGISSDYHAAHVVLQELTVHTPLTASAGSVTVTGTAATPIAARATAASSGAVAVAGTTAATTAGRAVAASAGSYAITGTDATLTYNESSGYTIPADAGSVAVTGTAATLVRSRLVTASAGALDVGGTSAGLVVSRATTASAGSITLTGAAASLARVIVATASSGSVAVTGTAAAFQRSLSVVGASGTISIAGTSVELRFNRAIQSAGGSVAVTGTAATLTYTPVGQNSITCSAGAFALTGTAVAFLAARALSASTGATTVTGLDAALSAAVAATPEPRQRRHANAFGSPRRIGSFGGLRRIRR